MKLSELDSALESFEKAQDMAHVQGDGAAESAIQKAIDDINFAIRQKNEDSKSETVHPISSGSTYGQFFYIFYACNCSVGYVTVWRRRFGADVLAQDFLAQRHFGAGCFSTT